jgi:hypothetical protein
MGKSVDQLIQLLEHSNLRLAISAVNIRFILLPKSTDNRSGEVWAAGRYRIVHLPTEL